MVEKEKEFEGRTRSNSRNLKAFDDIDELKEQIQNDFKTTKKQGCPDYPIFDENPHEDEFPSVWQSFDVSGASIGDSNEF